MYNIAHDVSLTLFVIFVAVFHYLLNIWLFSTVVDSLLIIFIT